MKGLVALLLGTAWAAGTGGSRSPAAVLELSDRFLEVKDEGHWFVEVPTLPLPFCGP